MARRSRDGTVLEVFGRHVNRAARIESFAQPGHVLASYAVYDFSVGWLRSIGVEWRVLGVVTPKGFSKAVSIHEPFLPGGAGPQPPFFETQRPPLSTSRRAIRPARSRSSKRAIARAAVVREDVRPEGLDREELFGALVGARGAPSPERSAPTETMMFRQAPAAAMTAGFSTLPPPSVAPGEDPLTHYLDVLERNAARLRRSPLRKIRAVFGRGSSIPTVVWVDDHPENNRALRELIEQRGIRVRTALNTEGAMALLRIEIVDLVITDMGRGDDATAGLDLLRGMREEGIRRPVAVFASMRAVAEYGDMARELGAAECTAGTVELFRFLAEQIRQRG